METNCKIKVFKSWFGNRASDSKFLRRFRKGFTKIFGKPTFEVFNCTNKTTINEFVEIVCKDHLNKYPSSKQFNKDTLECYDYSNKKQGALLDPESTLGENFDVAYEIYILIKIKESIVNIMVKFVKTKTEEEVMLKFRTKTNLICLKFMVSLWKFIKNKEKIKENTDIKKVKLEFIKNKEKIFEYNGESNKEALKINLNHQIDSIKNDTSGKSYCIFTVNDISSVSNKTQYSSNPTESLISTKNTKLEGGSASSTDKKSDETDSSKKDESLTKTILDEKSDPESKIKDLPFIPDEHSKHEPPKDKLPKIEKPPADPKVIIKPPIKKILKPKKSDPKIKDLPPKTPIKNEPPKEEPPKEELPKDIKDPLKIESPTKDTPPVPNIPPFKGELSKPLIDSSKIESPTEVTDEVPLIKKYVSPEFENNVPKAKKIEDNDENFKLNSIKANIKYVKKVINGQTKTVEDDSYFIPSDNSSNNYGYFLKFKIKQTKITIIHGDCITINNRYEKFFGKRLSNICIVNAANSECRPGGGICGRIYHSAKGLEELDNAAMPKDDHGKMYVPTGTAASVDTPNVFADKDIEEVVHGVAPKGNNPDVNQLILSAYYNTLKVAKSKVIILPSFGTGIYGCNIFEVSMYAAEGIIDFIMNPNEKPKDHTLILAYYPDAMFETPLKDGVEDFKDFLCYCYAFLKNISPNKCYSNYSPFKSKGVNFVTKKTPDENSIYDVPSYLI